MGNPAYKKARAKEQELRRAFEDEGWFAIRSPGSSGGFDLIAAKDGRIIVIELKYVEAGEKARFEEKEFWPSEDRNQHDDGLMWVADQFDVQGNAFAYGVARWKRDTDFYACPPPLLDKANKDDSGQPFMDPEKKDEYIKLPPESPDDVEQAEAQPDD